MTAPMLQNSLETQSTLQRFAARGWHWPLLIVGLLAIPIVAGGYLAYQATHDAGFALEADYYRKAVGWDAQMAQEVVNAQLGWQATMTAKPAGNSLDVTAEFHTKTGAELPKLTVQIDGFFLARSQDLQEAEMQLGPDGRYHATLHLPHAGLHELHVRATTGQTRFTLVRRVDIFR